jgi:hypothetical protein
MFKKLLLFGAILSSLFSYDTNIFYNDWIKKIKAPLVKVGSDLHDDRLKVYIIITRYRPWLEGLGYYLSVNDTYRYFKTSIDNIVAQLPYRYDTFKGSTTNFTHGGHITLKVENPKQPSYIFGYDVMQIHDITDVGVFRRLKAGKKPTEQYTSGKIEYYDLNNLSSFDKVICINTGKAHKDYRRDGHQMLITHLLTIPHSYGGYVHKGKENFKLACSQIRETTF